MRRLTNVVLPNMKCICYENKNNYNPKLVSSSHFEHSQNYRSICRATERVLEIGKEYLKKAQDIMLSWEIY